MKPIDQFSHWKQIREGLIEVIDKFDRDQLGFVPFDGSRSAGEIMLHIADAEEGWIRYVVTKEINEWPAHYTVENYPSRDAIKHALYKVHRYTLDYLTSLEESDLEVGIETPWGEVIPMRWILWHILEHEVHHRGELSLILGFLGKTGLDV